jgi:hypothetical protein
VVHVQPSFFGAEATLNVHMNGTQTMIGDNRQLVTNEPVEVQDCRKITDYFKGLYRRIYPNLIKENRRMSTCSRLDLQTLGSQPIMPKNLPDHWTRKLPKSLPMNTTDSNSPICTHRSLNYPLMSNPSMD